MKGFTFLFLPLVIQHLVKAGLIRDVHVEPGSLKSLLQLSLWVSTLSLHLLAAVPEFKARKGPGLTLLHDGESLQLLRYLLAMVRLWNLSKLNIICTEKEMDLTARLFSMVSRLSRKMDDETLLDECLMLPHRVLIPPLDTVLAPRGVLSSLHTIRMSPLSFTFGSEPDLGPSVTPPFVEGLTYIDNPHADFYYDSIQKLYLGSNFGLVWTMFNLYCRSEARQPEALHALQGCDSVGSEQDQLRSALGQEVEQKLPLWRKLETDEGVRKLCCDILRCNFLQMKVLRIINWS